MKNNSWKTFLRDLGKLMHFPAGMVVLVLPVVVYYQEWFTLIPFGVMGLVSVSAGQLLIRFSGTSENSGLGTAFMLVALGWIIIPLLGSIPFYGTAWVASGSRYQELAHFSNFGNSFFEAMSGFTHTGLTLVSDPARLPFSLQWWRTLSEWIGGIGVIVLAELLLSFDQNEQHLHKVEPGLSFERKELENGVLRKIIWIYMAYSVVPVGLFYFSGIPFWEALNHGLIAFGLGGFSITADSFSHYNAVVKALTICIMILGALGFKMHYLLLIKWDLRGFLRQTELRYFVLLLILAGTALYAMLPDVSGIDLMFQTVSAAATSGLYTVDISRWPLSPLLVLIFLMVLGANSGSAGGGIKTVRFIWLIKGLKRRIKGVWERKETAIQVRFNGEVQEEADIRRNLEHAAIIGFLWILSLFLGTLLLSLVLYNEFTLVQILFEAGSALSNVGLSSGVTTASLPAEGKYILIALMWIGRLEILAALILFLSPFYLRR